MSLQVGEQTPNAPLMGRWTPCASTARLHQVQGPGLPLHTVVFVCSGAHSQWVWPCQVKGNTQADPGAPSNGSPVWTVKQGLVVLQTGRGGPASVSQRPSQHTRAGWTVVSVKVSGTRLPFSSWQQPQPGWTVRRTQTAPSCPAWHSDTLQLAGSVRTLPTACRPTDTEHSQLERVSSNCPPCWPGQQVL